MNATELMIPEVAGLLAADPSVPTEVMTPSPSAACRPLLAGFVDLHTFNSVAWHAHRRLWGCPWDRAGTFGGTIAVTVAGPRTYHYIPDEDDPLYFLRASGELIKPGALTTDGGSIPRVAWAIPGLDPWTYLAAYVVHDWLFNTKSHSFEQANLILAEALYTQMTAAPNSPFRAPEDWRVAWAVHAAVSSVFGRRAWAAPNDRG